MNPHHGKEREPASRSRTLEYLLQKKRFHTAKILLLCVFAYVALRDIAGVVFGIPNDNQALLINALEAATYLYGVRWVAQRGAYTVERWRGVLQPGRNDPFYRQPGHRESAHFPEQ